MSPKRDRTVRELVEKYRKKFTREERPLLRRLIRVENPEMFQPEGSKLKTLDRELGRSFRLDPVSKPKPVDNIIESKSMSTMITSLNDVNAKFLTSKWDLLLKRAEKAGGFLIEVEFGKLCLGDADPITGWYKRSYDKKPIQGILVLEGALDLQRAIGLDAPRRYGAFFLTKSSAEKADWIRFKEKYYYVEDVKPIVEGVDFSYNIFIMAERRKEELFDSDPDLPQ